MNKIWPFVKFCLYSFAYLFGHRNAVIEMEAKSNKSALDEATTVLDKREKVRAKYDKIRNSIPNSWPDKLRKTNKDSK